MRPTSIKLVVAAGIFAAVIGLFIWQRDPVSTPGGENAPAGKVPLLGRGNPPAAYIEFGRPGRWLAQGSSCWTSGGSTACADAAGPGLLKGSPTVVVSRGAVGRIHLGFTADHAQLSIGGKAVPVTGNRTITFTTRRSGIIEIFTGHGHDDASYYGRVAFAAHMAIDRIVVRSTQ